MVDLKTSEPPRVSDRGALTPRESHAIGDRLLAIVQRFLVETRPRTDFSPALLLDSRLEDDLGLDSLARAELGVRLEREFRQPLPDSVLLQADTIRDLAIAVAAMSAVVESLETSVEPALGADEEGEPSQASTLLEVLAWHVKRHPDRTHVTLLASDVQHLVMSYGELDRRAGQIAAGLQRAGLHPGQACALMLPTSLEFFAVYCGILMAGGIPVPIYPPFRMSQLEEHLRRQRGILANCEARVLVTTRQARIIAKFLRAEVPSIKSISSTEALEERSGAFAPVQSSSEDIALIQYTSGSTGDPKGVLLTHANLLANVRAMGHAAKASSADIFVSWLPLYHDMGLIGAWMGSLYFGVHLVLMSPTSFLARPSRWLWAVHRFRATVTAAPNFAYELCASRLDDASIEGLDLSSLRWAFNGAEPVSVETVTRFVARYAAHGLDARAIAPVYGLAECALDLSFPPAPRGALVDTIDRDALMKTSRAVPVPASDPRAHRLVACGHLLPGYAARITGLDGEVLEERQVGRIHFQGPSATQGYNRNPTATKALFDGSWLDTGDVGYLAAGDLYVTGRAKDMIIRGGHNIYPNELEEAIGALPGVRKGCVAVLGIADAPRATERVVVLAESRETQPATQEKLKAQINRLTADTIGGPADDVVIVPPHTVLKTSSGKIRRAATRELYLRGIAHLPQRAVWLQVCRLVWQNALARGKRMIARTLLITFALWAWVAFLIVAVLGVAVGMLVPSVRACRAAARLLARALATAVGVQIDVVGCERIPRDCPYILVANHSSYIDAIVLAAALPAQVGFVTKGEFRRQWLMRRVLEAVGAPFVERFDAAKGIEDTRTIEQAARRGESLVFFPEGTFTSDPRLQAFRMGAFVIAAGNALPVVPVAILGTRSILPPDAWTPKPGRVVVMIGDPIFAHGKEWMHAVQLREAAWTWINATREARSSAP